MSKQFYYLDILLKLLMPSVVWCVIHSSFNIVREVHPSKQFNHPTSE